MYRTSSNDMSTKVYKIVCIAINLLFQTPVEKKSHAIPKYQGFIPTKDAQGHLGKGYTAVTRRCFLKDKLEGKPNLFASTG